MLALHDACLLTATLPAQPAGSRNASRLRQSKCHHSQRDRRPAPRRGVADRKQTRSRAARPRSHVL